IGRFAGDDWREPVAWQAAWHLPLAAVLALSAAAELRPARRQRVAAPSPVQRPPDPPPVPRRPPRAAPAAPPSRHWPPLWQEPHRGGHDAVRAEAFLGMTFFGMVGVNTLVVFVIASAVTGDPATKHTLNVMLRVMGVPALLAALAVTTHQAATAVGSERER